MTKLEYNRLYYARNNKILLERKKKYYEKHRTKILDYSRKYSKQRYYAIKEGLSSNKEEDAFNKEEYLEKLAILRAEKINRIHNRKTV